MAEYVSNKALLGELKLYRADLDALRESGSKENPQMSVALASALLQINQRLSTSFRFVGYSFKDEMISDGVFKCFKKVDKFDPEKSDNPFAFFTQIAWNEFIARIKLERNQVSVKAKMVREKMADEFVQSGVDVDPDASNAFVEFLKDNDVLVDYHALAQEAKIDQHQNGVHPSLVHRNKSGYKKKKENPVQEEMFDLSEFGI